jgi:hypothetical protein
MFSYEFSINILVLLLSMLAAGFIGYSLRSRQLRKKQFKIIELRKEMIDNHALILELQKEYVELESRFMESRTPVLGMRNVARDFESQDFEVLDSAI